MTTITKPESKAPAQEMEPKVSPAIVNPNALLGTWNNVNPATRDLVKIVITKAGSGISVHAYGACVPNPCDWGAVAGIAYSNGVTSTAVVAFSAQYTFNFSKVILTGQLADNLLTVESFTEFTDNSGRNNYYATMQMKK